MKFTEDQRIWIIEAYAASKSPTTVRRDFLIKYGISGRKKNEYTRTDFARVFLHFKENGSVQRTQGSGKKIQNPQAKALIKTELIKNEPHNVKQNIYFFRCVDPALLMHKSTKFIKKS